MGITFPPAVRLALVVAAAAIAYSQAQSDLALEPAWRFGLGLGSVVVAALLAAQGAVTNTVRQLRGRPPR